MKFKCIQSGNTVEFFQEHEIAEMRKHTGYTEVPVEVETPKVTTTSKKTVVKQDETSIDG
jgi:signal recognition particle subunit SEC65